MFASLRMKRVETAVFMYTTSYKKPITENCNLVRATTNTCPIKLSKEKKKQFLTRQNNKQVKYNSAQDNALHMIGTEKSKTLSFGFPERKILKMVSIT